MNIEAVREARHREPFEPFIIRLADGRSVPVPDPYLVAIGRRQIVVLGEDDSATYIEPSMIVSLDNSSK